MHDATATHPLQSSACTSKKEFTKNRQSGCKSHFSLTTEGCQLRPDNRGEDVAEDEESVRRRQRDEQAVECLPVKTRWQCSV